MIIKRITKTNDIVVNRATVRADGVTGVLIFDGTIRRETIRTRIHFVVVVHT